MYPSPRSSHAPLTLVPTLICPLPVRFVLGYCFLFSFDTSYSPRRLSCSSPSDPSAAVSQVVVLELELPNVTAHLWRSGRGLQSSAATQHLGVAEQSEAGEKRGGGPTYKP
ncbi:hypothetical protein CLOP_g2673 [Closterium sp. NIES-67]|nr:hypothetical protein CLOP_g2673 [Closterium sp. NIES-67]